MKSVLTAKIKVNTKGADAVKARYICPIKTKRPHRKKEKKKKRCWGSDIGKPSAATSQTVRWACLLVSCTLQTID